MTKLFWIAINHNPSLEYYTHISQFIINFGIGLNLLLAISIVARLKNPNDRSKAFTFALLLLALTSILVSEVLAYYRIDVKLAVIHSALLSIPFAIGPLYCIFYDILIEGNTYWDMRRIRHFIPSLVIFMMLLLLHYISHSLLKQFSAEFLQGVFSTIMYLHIATYFIYTIKKLKRHVPEKVIGTEGFDRAVWIRIYLSGAYVIIFLLLSVDYYLKTVFSQTALAFLVLVSAVHFTISNRYPMKIDYYISRRNRNHFSRVVAAIDPVVLREKLFHVLEQERLYLYEDLTLAMVACEVNVRPHHLSHFINHYMETNFNQLINEYRVREAQRLLLEDSDRAILSVAFESGFNSKASFNRAFRKITGKTPSQFRETD